MSDDREGDQGGGHGGDPGGVIQLVDLTTLEVVTKPEIFGRTLEGGVTALFFDGTADGVMLPAQLRGQRQVILNFSWRYNVSDFTFDGQEARASLSFGGVPSLCVVPWHAVWCIANDARSDAWFWVAAMPAEIQRSFGVSALGEVADVLVAHQGQAGMTWHRAGDDRRWTAAPLSTTPAATSGARTRPAWLRVVGDPAQADPAARAADDDADGHELAAGEDRDDSPPEPSPQPPSEPSPGASPPGRPTLRRIK